MPGHQFITIEPIRENGQPVGWTMEYKGKKGTQPGNYPPVVLGKGSGDHEFTISIKGDDEGITFAKGTNHWKDGDNALWVHDVTNLPPVSPPSKMTHKQIHDVKLHNEKQLTFKDSNNGQKMTLAYQLNFDGAPALDPIIENGGGPGGGNIFDYIQSHPFESAIAFLLIAAGAIALLRRRRQTSKAGPAGN